MLRFVAWVAILLSGLGLLVAGLSLNLDGLNVPGTLAAGEVAWHTFEVAAVPEPSSFAPLFCGAALGLPTLRRRNS